jgi:choline dehydrogenase-like flavoprotein
MASFDYDVLIIGSRFGGSVAALRAAEKGYRVGVMESGQRWKDEEIPKTQWDLPGFLWFPGAELYGIQRIEYVDDVLVLCGAGVGGGSHVYANTLYVPPRKFFDAPEWAGITDWAGELAPYLDQASRVLGDRIGAADNESEIPAARACHGGRRSRLVKQGQRRGRIPRHLRQRLVKPGQPGQRSTIRSDRTLIETGQVAPGPRGCISQQRLDFRTGKRGHTCSLAARRADPRRGLRADAGQSQELRVI